MYPHTLAGWCSATRMAIPFFGRTLAGDLLYSGVLFGLHAWLSRTVARRACGRTGRLSPGHHRCDEDSARLEFGGKD